MFAGRWNILYFAKFGSSLHNLMKKLVTEVTSALSLFKCHLYWDSQQCYFVPVHYKWKLPWMFCGSYTAAKMLLNMKIFESKNILIFERSWRFWRDLLESVEWFICLVCRIKGVWDRFCTFLSDPVLCVYTFEDELAILIRLSGNVSLIKGAAIFCIKISLHRGFLIRQKLPCHVFNLPSYSHLFTSSFEERSGVWYQEK